MIKMIIIDISINKLLNDDIIIIKLIKTLDEIC